MGFSCKFSLYVGDIWNLELRKNDERIALDELDHQRTHAPRFGIFTHFYEHFEGHGPMASEKKKQNWAEWMIFGHTGLSKRKWHNIPIHPNGW